MTAERPSILTFARGVVDAVEAVGVEYLIGGSIAVWAWGQPRSTEDFDLVVHLRLEQMAALSNELAQRHMLVPVEIMLDLYMMDEGDLPVNALDPFSGYKADLFLLRPGDAFRESSLTRRRLVDLGPVLGEVFVHSPEDLMLNKLLYYRVGQQPKHVRDIATIVAMSRDLIEWTYFDLWLEKLQVAEVWQQVKDEAQARHGVAI